MENALVGKSYGCSKGLLVIVALVGLFFAPGTVSYLQRHEYGNAAICIAIIAAMAFLFVRILKIRVTFNQDTLVYRSLFATREMKWHEVERVFYYAVRQSINFIPVGTHRSIRVYDRSGQKFSFGNSVADVEELISHLTAMTRKAAFDRAAAAFNSGQEADFGDVRLSRDRGIQMKGLFGYKAFPLDQIRAYEIQKGHFHVWGKPRKSLRSVSIRNVANVVVLMDILDSIYKRAPA